MNVSDIQNIYPSLVSIIAETASLETLRELFEVRTRTITKSYWGCTCFTKNVLVTHTFSDLLNLLSPRQAVQLLGPCAELALEQEDPWMAITAIWLLRDLATLSRSIPRIPEEFLCYLDGLVVKYEEIIAAVGFDPFPQWKNYLYLYEMW